MEWHIEMQNGWYAAVLVGKRYRKAVAWLSSQGAADRWIAKNRSEYESAYADQV